MKNSWIVTDTVRITEQGGSNGSSVKVHFTVSPYDVPDAVRARVDESSNGLIIEFRYIPINERKIEKFYEGVKFQVGKNTNRIYKIFLDKLKDASVVIETEFSPQRIEESIGTAEAAIEKFIQHNENMNKFPLKYKAAKNVLHEYKHELANL
jgi:hypothetical protein